MCRWLLKGVSRIVYSFCFVNSFTNIINETHKQVNMIYIKIINDLINIDVILVCVYN